jgi:hypothetical protein
VLFPFDFGWRDTVVCGGQGVGSLWVFSRSFFGVSNSSGLGEIFLLAVYQRNIGDKK